MKTRKLGFSIISLIFAASLMTSPAKAATIDIVGSWDLYVNWSCNTPGTTATYASVLTFNADTTWTYSFGGGRWYQSAGMLIFKFTNYPELVYSGNNTQNAMVGIQGYISGGSQGCWYMIKKPATAAPQASSAAPDNGVDLLVGTDAGR